MTSKVYVVTDLGPGDGGKGGVVHAVATKLRAHTIIKRGGAQGSHGVCTSKGERFAFSQWGCGTFEGIKTHLSQQMIVSPEGLLNEADALRYHHGIHNAFDLLSVDQRALCATPFHGIASRLKELARGDNPRGTIGTGVGEAYRCLARYPELAITAKDLSRPDLRDLLAAAREQLQIDLQPIIQADFLASDKSAVDEQVSLLYDDGFLDYAVQRFAEVSGRANIVDPAFLEDAILSQDGTAVVETSHGILTDRLMGFHPHTSAIRTLPEFTARMLAESGYDEQVVNIGVTRAYAIRHGAGPMPTANLEMAESLLPGSNKDENRYQGKVRVGPIDYVLLRYAIEACGGASTFDGLAISWFDQIIANQVWHSCSRYAVADDSAFFSPSGEIKVSRGAEPEQLLYQEALGKRLNDCVPEVHSQEVPTGTSEELYAFCAQAVEQAVSVPVRMVSFGPTDRDKLFK